jgi:hypothetical protein
MYDFTLSSVFAAYLRGDVALIRAIQAFPGHVDLQDEGLTFTLPALFDLIRLLHENAGLGALPGTRADYLRFRGALYRNPTNSQLKAFGGHVVLAVGQADHDQSLYRLVRLAPDA